MTGLGVLLPLVSPLLPEPGSSGPGRAATVPRGRGWAGLGWAALGWAAWGWGWGVRTRGSPRGGRSAGHSTHWSLHTLVPPGCQGFPPGGVSRTEELACLGLAWECPPRGAHGAPRAPWGPLCATPREAGEGDLGGPGPLEAIFCTSPYKSRQREVRFRAARGAALAATAARLPAVLTRRDESALSSG